MRATRAQDHPSIPWMLTSFLVEIRASGCRKTGKNQDTTTTPWPDQRYQTRTSLKSKIGTAHAVIGHQFVVSAYPQSPPWHQPSITGAMSPRQSKLSLSAMTCREHLQQKCTP